MNSEFYYSCSDGRAPAFLTWLRSHSIKGRIAVRGANEIVEFNIPAKWSGDQTEQFAQSLFQRITDYAAVTLLQLRDKPSSEQSSSCLVADIRRIADHFDPPPPDIVGSEYVAQKLGCTTTWIADLVRREEIPNRCIVPGTGRGKPWKFYREQIGKWIENR